MEGRPCGLHHPEKCLQASPTCSPAFTFPLTQLGIARPPATLRREQLGLGQEGWRAWCYGGFEPTEGSRPYFLPSQRCRESTEAGYPYPSLDWGLEGLLPPKCS